MGKKNNSSYHFWRWLIMQIVNIPRLYVLVWGLVILLLAICLKADMAALIGRMII